MSQHDYSTLAGLFESYIMQESITQTPDNLYAPIRYINEIGGKRIRPVLLLMSYNLWFDDVSNALKPALAIEFFHNFSLMHDDIMDEADLRRGHQSVHARFGRNAAILSGDALLIKCFELLIDFERDHRLPSSITQLLAKTALEICEGQQLDMDFEKRQDVSMQEYVDMIRKKTACLIGAALRMGAMVANASSEDGLRLYSAGENMGIAFQIQDDILDVFGDPDTTGKVKGGDVLQGKKNFLYIKASEILTGKEKKDFLKYYQNAKTEEDVRGILTIYHDLNLQQIALENQMHYFNKGVNAFSEIPQLDTSVIRRFSSALLKRDH